MFKIIMPSQTFIVLQFNWTVAVNCSPHTVLNSERGAALRVYAVSHGKKLAEYIISKEAIR